MADETKTTEKAGKAAEKPPEASQPPAKVKMHQPHGFIDENGRHRYWAQGDVIANEEEIALLIERKAPIVFLDD